MGDRLVARHPHLPHQASRSTRKPQGRLEVGGGESHTGGSESQDPMEAPTPAPVSLPAPVLSGLLAESSSVEPAGFLGRAPEALGQVLARCAGWCLRRALKAGGPDAGSGGAIPA